jgi:hypothetical protein
MNTLLSCCRCKEEGDVVGRKRGKKEGKKKFAAAKYL